MRNFSEIINEGNDLKFMTITLGEENKPEEIKDLIVYLLNRRYIFKYTPDSHNLKASIELEFTNVGSPKLCRSAIEDWINDKNLDVSLS